MFFPKYHSNECAFGATLKGTRLHNNTKLFYLYSGTFKIQKTRLQREGYDPRLTTDQIYFLNARAARYEAIDEELFNAVGDGRMSL